MESLRKTYILSLAIALLVLMLLRPPMTLLGWAGVGITVCSLAAMAAWATGVTALGGRVWLGWLALQIAVDVIAVTGEMGTVGLTSSPGGTALAVAVSGLILLPLYLALYRLGRRRFPRRDAPRDVGGEDG